MNRVMTAAVLACVGSLSLAGTAAANASPPRSPVTKQLAGLPCSVTASFSVNSTSAKMTYGGGVSCAGGVGQKTLDVVPQVFNVVHGKPLWFNISLAGRYQGPTPINPLRLTDGSAYVSSHTYRVLAYGRVTLPDGRSAATTACSGECTGAPTLSIGSSYRYDAQPVTTAEIPDVPCSVGQGGLVFTLVNGSYVTNYSGFSVCGGPGSPGKRSLTICVQVANRINGKAVWFTVSGSCLSTGLIPTNPAQLGTARTGYLGHGYRVMASTTIQYPTSHGTLTRSRTVYSAAAAP
ncbi:MAG: hypothetical protein ACXVUL_00120 [Solirubrobacteraceae bacterium]